MVNVRSGPGMGYHVVGQLAPWQVVQVTGISRGPLLVPHRLPVLLRHRMLGVVPELAVKPVQLLGWA